MLLDYVLHLQTPELLEAGDEVEYALEGFFSTVLSLLLSLSVCVFIIISNYLIYILPCSSLISSFSLKVPL